MKLLQEMQFFLMFLDPFGVAWINQEGLLCSFGSFFVESSVHMCVCMSCVGT